jgi:heptosyltransferase-2/heptosyltransferase-3
VYLCDPEPKAQWLLDHAGVPREWVIRAHDFPAPHPMHWTDWWLAIGQLTPAALGEGAPLPGVQPYDAVPRLYIDERARADCQQWLAGRGWQHDPLVLIQAGNKRTLKRGRLAAVTDEKFWPAERWAAVAQGVLRVVPDAQVLLCGAPAEAAVIEAIRSAAGSTRVHNLADELPVARLLALLERAHSMISVDTGPAHAAAALDCPLTVLFAGQDQRWWLPRSRLGRVTALGGAAGAGSRLVDIGVAEVLEAWQALGGRVTS